jgi:GNAT superfamily N-acetyltransferase
LPARLVEHLTGWTGQAYPAGPASVVVKARGAGPGWDGKPYPVVGIVDPSGRAGVGVCPEYAEAVAEAMSRGHLADLAALRRELPILLDRPACRIDQHVFRWTTKPAPLPDEGVWVDADAGTVPAWLRPFGGQVLLALDRDGRYLAGVGLKRHDAAGYELAVCTEPHARGRGLARGLVAQAARRVLDLGAVPTYLHPRANTASARVATAAGFPDLGWTALLLSEPRILTWLRARPLRRRGVGR